MYGRRKQPPVEKSDAYVRLNNTNDELRFQRSEAAQLHRDWWKQIQDGLS